MNYPELTIKHTLHELNLKKEQELDIYIDNDVYIKIAVSDKGTPVILIDSLDSVIIDKWTGHSPYKKKMNALWDEEHKNDPIEED